MMKFLISIMMLLLSISSFALDVQEWPDIQEGIVSIKIKEPPHRVGYTIGDKSDRHVEVTIKKPYVLIKESLPIPGYERKYKGQDIGIVLDAMNHSYKENKTSSTLVLDLTYQIFTNSVVAKPGFLPAEYIRLLNPSDPKKKVFKYRIPEYQIAISPLSIFGNIKIEEDMRLRSTPAPGSAPGCAARTRRRGHRSAARLARRVNACHRVVQAPLPPVVDTVDHALTRGSGSDWSWRPGDESVRLPRGHRCRRR